MTNNDPSDTRYLAAQNDDRSKRNAIGVYNNAGLSQYTVANASISYNTGVNFPVNWDPRYTLAQGVGAFPDHRENYRVHSAGPRTPATTLTNTSTSYYVNPTDNIDGFVVNGTLPTYEAQGVHSLTDVPVFAMGPCQADFGGVYGNIDIFFNIANCLGLARANNATGTAAQMAGSSNSSGTSTQQFTGAASVNDIDLIRGGVLGLAVLVWFYAN